MAKSSVLLLQVKPRLIMLFLMLLFIKGSSHNDNYSNNNKCGISYCGPNEPVIKFPFQLVKGEKDACDYPGFCLYCTTKNQTMLVLNTITFQVTSIHYKIQQIELSDPEDCLPMKIMKVMSYNHTIRPYQFVSSYIGNEINKLIFFHCPTVPPQTLGNSYHLNRACPLQVANPDNSLVDSGLSFCAKLSHIFATVRALDLQQNSLNLRWSKPDCRRCQAKGKFCKWKNNDTEGAIKCFHCNNERKKIPTSFILHTAVILGSILLGLVITITLYKIIFNFRKKKEDQVRVEKFLEDYKAEKPTRFTYADLKRITGGFKEKLGEGTHGAVFRGKLSNEILVAVKILNNSEGEGNEFINEVGIMGKIHHINVVRLLGFCAEGSHRALVYNLFPNGSLQSFIFSPDVKDHFLGWEKLQQIALGIAKGIEYLHQGCNHPIIHFDINPHNVLLDDNLTPKISDFGLAKLCSKNKSLVSMTAAGGTLGYIAPEVFSRNFGNVSYKSDIYSYGMLLLEMVGGRKNVDMSSEQNFNVLYPDWIHNLVDGDVHIHVQDEGDVKIAKKLATVGLWCIQWRPVNRPSIKTVIQMLETKEEEKLPVPPNPFHSTTSTSTSGFISRPLDLEVIEE